MGVKVLDLSRVLAGPLCTMMLGDLGANVIKVERPRTGDETRGWGPPFDDRGESAYFLSTNRNKLSIAADFREARDRAVVVSLALQADVVVENFLPGALERAGILRAEVQEQNAAAIWCSITGFGLGSLRPGYDYVVQAESGWMAITGEVNGAPMKTAVAFADLIAGKDAAIAILAALAGRGRGNDIGRHLVISLADSARAALVNVAQNALVSGAEARRWGNAHANLAPYQLFQAADRGLVIAVGSDEQWRAATEALGLEELRDDQSLAKNAGRVAQRDRITREFQRVLSERPASNWIAALERKGVPCGVVKRVLEAIADAAEASPTAGMPSSVGGRVRFPPPTLNQHGEAIRTAGWGVFSGSE